MSKVIGPRVCSILCEGFGACFTMRKVIGPCVCGILCEGFGACFTMGKVIGPRVCSILCEGFGTCFTMSEVIGPCVCGILCKGFGACFTVCEIVGPCVCSSVGFYSFVACHGFDHVIIINGVVFKILCSPQFTPFLRVHRVYNISYNTYFIIIKYGTSH